MCVRKVTFLFFLLITTGRLSAATFTVISNADSGPGTLRQALLDAAANGTAAVDYIQFNLPGSSRADITILLKTQLPDVTGNIVIDATTQPGPALGVSNAKVIISPLAPAQYFNAFNVSASVGATDAVEFYGLYIKDFSPNQRGLGDAIVTNANCMLVVGAPGKGNVISGNWYALLGYFQNAKIQSNFIGLAPDGKTAEYNADILYSSSYYFDLFDNLLIGGSDPADGNVIIGGTDDGIDIEGLYQTATQTLTVENNYFGTDYTGTVALPGTVSPFITAKDPSINLLVYNNVFIGANPDIGIMTTGTAVVKGNYFGTDKTQTHPFGQGYEAIHVVTSVTITIGGDAAADQNIFTNFYNPIFADNDANMLIIKNSFYCNDHVSVGNLISSSYVTITNLTDTNISGLAAPGALIQLYYTTASGCPYCNPTTWFTNVTADANGNWTYNGNTTQDILASSTVNNNTFGFQRFLIYPSDVTIQNFNCQHKGSIKVNQDRTGRIQFVWIDNATGKVAGTGREIDNLPPGVYNLQINEGTTCTILASGQFTINNETSYVLPQSFQTDCNNPTGNFTAVVNTAAGISVTAYYWLDSDGNNFSNQQNVSGLGVGTYYLYITDSNGCTSAKAIYNVLPPVSAPVIADNQVVITDANCSLSDGSITGLKISNAGNANYGWERTDGTQVAFGQTDLKSAPPGQYYFFAIYDVNCPPVKSKVFTVNSKNGITINDGAISITPSTCANQNGSITGLNISGATTYKWIDDKNNAVGNNADLANVGAGTYNLVASNSACSIQSPGYTVTNIPVITNFPSTYTVTNTTCNQNNGGVSVTFGPGQVPYAYRWADPTGGTVIKDGPLVNAAPGIYQLYVTDSNQCESLYQSYTVGATPLLQIVAGAEQITSDNCGLGLGSIQNISVTGGIPPYTYNWLNSQQTSVGVASSLASVVAGTYTLQVNDSTPCGLASQSFTIADESSVVAAPELNNLQICSPGAAILSVKNPQASYGYRLYASANDTNILAQNATGMFAINVTGSNSFYVSQFSGECESTRTEAQIYIGLSGLAIPNTFTPNNDGINDYWKIKGIENYPAAMVQIFTRYGQRVFESKGYAQPFDGKLNGTLLPPGLAVGINNDVINKQVRIATLSVLSFPLIR